MLCWIAERPPGLRGAGQARARLARGPALRPAPLAVRAGRDRRRGLARPPKHRQLLRGRRGGDVRARLPRPAAHLHPLGPGAPGAARRVRAHVRRRRRGDPGRDPRAAGGPARRVRPAGAHRRAPLRRRRGRRLGRRDGDRAPRRGRVRPSGGASRDGVLSADGADGRRVPAGSSARDHRPAPVRRRLDARRVDPRPAQPLPPRVPAGPSTPGPARTRTAGTVAVVGAGKMGLPLGRSSPRTAGR